ncbi:peptide chain release factor N(5)-glutamine methyltransferase [Ancylothrix sp. C2]|uniref:peptide chain release factor N(5)-glutamine methyltransferase n=1 Tax=Ancylothrix sp. D3o TaxID=2953691 RepID=UPI0021BB1CF4|nr:peptide chain release factor N(5)-glutamine methyltransferase [Ancylothrix sp. D3o]MCT7948382.1 peptide chain release factor N(5)-glutamine methyltransferase [Ancylothrix sp. D3o]
MTHIISGRELWQWRNQAVAASLKANISASELNWLLKEIAGLDSLSLRLESFKNQPEIKLSLPFFELNQLWQRRLIEKVPVQYLLGITHWRNFSLTVSEAVLIPRPETEQIIDIVLAETSGGINFQGNWADLGTGSGAIAIGLAESLTKSTIHAIDYSPEALSIAKTNAEKLGFAERIKFYQGSWFEPLAELQGKLSGIVSNPPYIPAGMIPDLQPEVALHEPHLALAGGEDGLDCIRHLINTAPKYLQNGGIWLIEMMAGQADTVAKLLHSQGNYQRISIIKDLAGVERFALAYIGD